MNVQLDKCNAFASAISRKLYPSRQDAVAGWIRDIIGEPEFEWDYDTVFFGFCLPVNQYIRKTRPVVNGSICAAMIEAEGKDLDACRALVFTAERICHATRAFEDLLFGHQYKDGAAGFASFPPGAMKDSIASSLLLMMSNIFLYRNPMGLDDSALVDSFDYCAKETARMRYVAGMQIGWMQRDDQPATMDRAANYAVNGPIGAGIRMMLTLTSITLKLSPAAQAAISEAAGRLSILESIHSGIENATPFSLRMFAEDFRLGKVTPLTALTSQDRKLPIKSIPKLLAGLKIGVVIENALGKAIDAAKNCAREIGTLANRNPEMSGLSVMNAYAEDLLEKTSRLADRVEGIQRYSING